MIFKCAELLGDTTDWKMIQAKINKTLPRKEKKEKKRKERKKERKKKNIEVCSCACKKYMQMYLSKDLIMSAYM